MTKVLYPGSFDPITNGHINIIKQAEELFDEVVIAIMQNPKKKNCFFSYEERLDIIRDLYKNNSKIEVVTSRGATVDVALSHRCKAIVRGFRGLSDYDYEVQLSQINKDLSNGEINTICLFADQDYQFISSSMVKEVFELNKDISKYVSPIVVEKMLSKKFEGRKI